MFLGTALTTIPASMWMARVGRRTGFVAGALLGAMGGVLAALGIWLGSLVLLSLGTLLVGAYQAFGQFYRFAACSSGVRAVRAGVDTPTRRDPSAHQSMNRSFDHDAASSVAAPQTTSNTPAP